MNFAQRHIGPSSTDIAGMLAAIGYGSLDELTTAALPAGLANRALSLPEPLSEDQMIAELRAARQPEHGCLLDDRPRLLRHPSPRP